MPEKFFYHSKRKRYTDAEKSRQIGEVLHWVNEERLDHQLDPLDEIRPGMKRSTLVCPIARSVCDEAGQVTVASWGLRRLEQDAEGNEEWGKNQSLPSQVADFIRRFDTTDEFDQFVQ